jgi:hypothetical protein
MLRQEASKDFLHQEVDTVLSSKLAYNPPRWGSGKFHKIARNKQYPLISALQLLGIPSKRKYRRRLRSNSGRLVTGAGVSGGRSRATIITVVHAGRFSARGSAARTFFAGSVSRGSPDLPCEVAYGMEPSRPPVNSHHPANDLVAPRSLEPRISDSRYCDELLDSSAKLEIARERGASVDVERLMDQFLKTFLADGEGDGE